MLRPEPLCKVTSSSLLPTHTYRRDLRKDQEGPDAHGRLSGLRRYSRASHRLIPSELVVAAEIQLWELVEAALQNEWPHGGLDRVSSACVTAPSQLLQFAQLWDEEGRAGRYSSHSPSWIPVCLPGFWAAEHMEMSSLVDAHHPWLWPAGVGQWPEVPEPHLGLTQQLLELRLWQEAMVLHKGRNLGGPLALIVHSAMDLHVLVQDGQELLLALHKEGETMEPPSHSEGRAGTSGTLALGSEDRGSSWGDC